MAPDQISLLINAGIAGVFAIFALRILTLFLAFTESQSDKQETFINSLTAEWAKQLSERDAMWQKFIEDQRLRHMESMARLAEEIKAINLTVAANTQQLVALTNLLTEHDHRVQYSILAAQMKKDGERKTRPIGKAE